MTLTIGLKRYSSNSDLRRLCADPSFIRALQIALNNVADGPARQQAEARGKSKLTKWVKKDAKYNIPLGAKGQGKSFPSFETAVKWLLYKSEKTFANNQQTESRLAEEVHGNAKIRKLLFDFFRGPLAGWWKDLPGKVTIGAKTGRYAHFYSKVLCNRTIKEGFEYFGVGGGGFFSKNVTLANFSISEAAAFIADVAIQSKTTCEIRGRHVPGIDNLRYNLTEVDQKTRQALDEAFNLLSDNQKDERDKASVEGVFAANRNQAYVEKLRAGLLDLRALQDHPQYANWVAMVFNKFKENILINVAHDRMVVAVTGQNQTVLDSGILLSTQAAACRTTGQQLRFLQTFLDGAAANNYLMRPRQGAPIITGLKLQLQPQLDAEPDKTPHTLQQRNPALYDRVRRKGEDDAKRLEYNVDPDHQWTQFMINHNAVVGAGPSGTTSFTLGLVEKVLEGRRDHLTTEYAVAMALFSFWQRKKKLLKYQSTVHTWNEVCAALDHHHGTDRRVANGFLQVSDSGEGDYAGSNIYAYPTSFDQVGCPVYPESGITFEALWGE